MPRGPEAKVKSQVKLLLKEFEGLYSYWPVPTGRGPSGLDCYICYLGSMIVVETKAPKKEPTPRQRLTIRALEAAGAEVFIIDGTEPWRDLSRNFVLRTITELRDHLLMLEHYYWRGIHPCHRVGATESQPLTPLPELKRTMPDKSCSLLPFLETPGSDAPSKPSSRTARRKGGKLSTSIPANPDPMPAAMRGTHLPGRMDNTPRYAFNDDGTWVDQEENK